MMLIDSATRKKHVRHLANVDGHGIARTKCNRTLVTFYNADHVSYFYMDGRRWSHPCKTCLPKDFEEAARDTMEAQHVISI